VVWDGSRYTALSEALFVALFAVGHGLLGSNPGFHFADCGQCFAVTLIKSVSWCTLRSVCFIFSSLCFFKGCCVYSLCVS
jgi:hypothetical protein